MTRAYIALLVFAAILASPFIVSAASGDTGNTPLKPDFEALGGIDADVQDCVKDVDFMRTSHMLLLKDKRADSVRHGDWNEKYEVEKCFSCHEFKKFCKECHDYNGVKPSCFSDTGGCHSNDKLDASERPTV